MRRILIIAGIALIGFAITLGVYIAGRLGEEEVALMAGALCGAGVAIPLGAGLGAALVLRRSRPSPPPPSWIVLSPPGPAPTARRAQPIAPPLIRSAGQGVNIIGDNDLGEE